VTIQFLLVVLIHTIHHDKSYSVALLNCSDIFLPASLPHPSTFPTDESNDAELLIEDATLSIAAEELVDDENFFELPIGFDCLALGLKALANRLRSRWCRLRASRCLYEGSD
jgi:hypothetical protein